MSISLNEADTIDLEGSTRNIRNRFYLLPRRSFWYFYIRNRFYFLPRRSFWYLYIRNRFYLLPRRSFWYLYRYNIYVNSLKPIYWKVMNVLLLKWASRAFPTSTSNLLINFLKPNYIHIYNIYTLFVCLYPMNLKWPQRRFMDVYPKVFDFCKILKMREQI